MTRAPSAQAATGYSGRPLAQKLGIKPPQTLVLLNAPASFEERLGPLPTGVTARSRLPSGHSLEFVLWFVLERSELEKRISMVRERLLPAASLWIAWPKKTSRVVTNMTEHVAREVLLPTGLVDNKVCAIDDTWSGLRFVIRLRLRR